MFLAGETRLATVLMNVSYRYATASSLLTEVMSQIEINRRLQNRETVFRNVPATAKASPGRISINVGPQPVIAGKTEQLLLISVFSTRDDGEVRLAAGTQLLISAPTSIVKNIDCGAYSKAEPTDDSWEVTYTVPRDITILSSDFQSIFAFICNFNAADVDQAKTDLITAELPDYTFVLMKKKDITITPRLGIIFDPYEKDCQLCGDGTANACDKSECFGLSDGKPYTCWYENRPAANPVSDATPFVGSTCHSCGIVNNDCSYFNQYPNDCKAPGDADYAGSAAQRCGMSCEYSRTGADTTVGPENPSVAGGPLSVQQLCKTKVVTGVPGKAFTVKASREGLVGQTTSSGHVIQSNDFFAALPDISARGKQVQVSYSGKTRTVTVEDVGPWYTDDPYWNLDGVPLAQKDQQANRAVTRGPNAGRMTNGAGIDLADGLYYYLTDGQDAGLITVSWGFVGAAPSTGIYPGSLTQFQSANFDSRDGTTTDTVILHCSAGNLQSTLNTLTDTTGTSNPLGRVSSHYVIAQNGDVYNLISEDKSAWHASQFNKKSIGVEIVSDCSGYTDAQYSSISNIVNYLKTKYNIQAQNVIGHVDVPNSGKTDPQNFAWLRIPANLHTA